MIYLILQKVHFLSQYLVLSDRTTQSSLFLISADLSNQDTVIEEEFEDAKGVIRIRISKKNRQYNGEKKEYERTNNDLKTYT